MNTSRYLDPVVLSALGNLSLSAKLVVDGLITGQHRSQYHGFNVEFSEHRPYLPGDELRYIDWKLLGKSDKLYLKQFEEESSLRAFLVLDCSGSMGFPPEGVSKLEYGKLVAASLAYLMLRQRDSVGLFRFAAGIEEYLAGRSNPAHLSALLDALERFQPQGGTDLSSVLHEVAERMHRRGLIIIISDLLQQPEKIMESLRLLRHRKHEVIVFQVLTREELELPYDGYLHFEDLEVDRHLITDPTALRREYQQRMRELLEFFHQGCLENHLDYVLLRTDEPLDQALASYVHLRMNRLRG